MNNLIILLRGQTGVSKEDARTIFDMIINDTPNIHDMPYSEFRKKVAEAHEAFVWMKENPEEVQKIEAEILGHPVSSCCSAGVTADDRCTDCKEFCSPVGTI